VYNIHVLFYARAAIRGGPDGRYFRVVLSLPIIRKVPKMRRLSDYIYMTPFALGLICGVAMLPSVGHAQSQTQQQIKQQQQAAQPGLTEARMNELRNYFYLSDRDNDGGLNPSEVQSILLMDNDNKKYTRPDLEGIIKSVDYNYNGMMEENELLIYMAYTKPSPGPVMDDETRFFVSFDENGDGFIQLDELRQKMSDFDDTLTDGDISEIFDRNDFDHNKKLNQREFKILMEFKE